MTNPYVNLYDPDRKFVHLDEEPILLRPSLRKSSHAYSRCQVAIVAPADMKRVFVGESEREYSRVAYNADMPTIAALAARFDFPEFRRALLQRDAYTPEIPT